MLGITPAPAGAQPFAERSAARLKGDARQRPQVPSKRTKLDSRDFDGTKEEGHPEEDGPLLATELQSLRQGVLVAVGAGVAVASAHADVVKLAVSLVPLVTVFQEKTFQ